MGNSRSAEYINAIKSIIALDVRDFKHKQIFACDNDSILYKINTMSFSSMEKCLTEDLENNTDINEKLTNFVISCVVVNNIQRIRVQLRLTLFNLEKWILINLEDKKNFRIVVDHNKGNYSQSVEQTIINLCGQNKIKCHVTKSRDHKNLCTVIDLTLETTTTT